MTVTTFDSQNIVVDTSGIADAAVTEAKLAAALENALIKGRGYNTSVGLTDANDAEKNSIVTITDTSVVSNLPSGLPSNSAFQLITIGTGAHTTATSISYQVCAAISKAINPGDYIPYIWCRSRYGAQSGLWSNWVKIGFDTNGAVQYENLSSDLVAKLLIGMGYVNNETGPIDADTIKRGTVYFVTSTGTCANLPNDAGSSPIGFLVTFGGGVSDGVNSVALQVFAEAQNTTASSWMSRMWYRSRYGASNNTWSSWQRVVSFDDISQVVNPPALCDLSMFRKIGVLGDSFASGSMYVNGEFIKQDYEQAWPKNLARQRGVEVVRYSQGGWGAYDWINASSSNEYGLAQFERDIAAENVCGLYMICFGINDSNPGFDFGGKSGGIGYIGSAEDIDASDYTQNANSFWGQVSRIISTIQDEAPDSKIVLTTLARENTSTRVSFSAAVRDIAAYWNLPVLYLYGDAFFQSSYWNNGLDGNHPTAPLYAGMAVAINRLFSESMSTYYSYFKSYTGV